MTDNAQPTPPPDAENKSVKAAAPKTPAKRPAGGSSEYGGLAKIVGVCVVALIALNGLHQQGIDIPVLTPTAVSIWQGIFGLDGFLFKLSQSSH